MSGIQSMPPVDLLIRTRKTTLIYKAQLLQASVYIESGKRVMVCTKHVARLITDLLAYTGLRCFSVKSREGIFWIVKWGIKCDLP